MKKATRKKNDDLRKQYDLKALVNDMMQSDVELFKRDTYLAEGGHRILNYHE